MKRLIALVALLCAASACTTTTENANTGAGNANANANATPAAAAAGPTQADIEARERQVWDALKAKNWDAFAGMMSDDFIMVSDKGGKWVAAYHQETEVAEMTPPAGGANSNTAANTNANSNANSNTSSASTNA